MPRPPSDPAPRAPLDVDGIRRDLVGPDRPLRHLELVETTGSTNADLLARHAAGEDITGAVLVAEYQTAGRGRHGRSWSTPPRSQITVSIGIGAGALAPEAWGWLPLLTGVAVADAVAATTGIEPGLKWPNDIQVGEKKLGGIL
ncbi:MAG: biotin--[acetyl-CoA-carboxylase] ligase, partial [Mycobacterium sp.]|nr:biotin--[acetyl-CoA-carboxylase] ligase [Mycobacterium sp.]